MLCENHLVTDSCRIYEIQHSEKIVDRQTRYLRDEEKIAQIEKRFGKITGKYVLYRRENVQANLIQYLNIEEYIREKRLRIYFMRNLFMFSNPLKTCRIWML